MTSIKARDLGQEHLGKYAIVPLAFRRSFQIREIRHLAYTVRESTYGEPHPPVDTSLGTKVVLIFSEIYPVELSPNDEVQILD